MRSEDLQASQEEVNKFRRGEHYKTVMGYFANCLAGKRLAMVWGDFKTAAIDLKNGIIYMPYWKGMDDDVRVMLVGHETGHALYTPVDMMHSENGVRHPRLLSGVINICEDDRVDRFQCRGYAGLRKNYEAGYKFLKALWWSKIDPTKFNLADRLNLDSKCPSEFPFQPRNAQEADIYLRFKSTSTPAQVLALAHEIFALIKQEQEEKKQQQQQQQQEGDEGDESESGEGDQEGDESESGEGDESESDSCDQEGDEGDESESDEGDSPDDGKPTDPTDPTEDVCITDEMFRDAESDLCDQEGGREVPDSSKIMRIDVGSTKARVIKASRVNEVLGKRIERIGARASWF